MDCNYTTIKTCELKGSTFRSHVLNFGNFDISEYEFATDFANTLGQKISAQSLEKFGNTVVLPLTVLEGKSGNIRADVWMTKDDVRDLAVRFEIAISGNCTGCSDTTEHDITVTFEELVIPVTVTQSVVNITLDFESLTPEQKADLRFDWEDFTPENIAELQQPAIEAAGNANEAAVLANQAAGSAETAANEATQAASVATDAINGANTAATNANQAAEFATSATQEAATATGQATAAASSANSAATAANAGALNAESKAQLADTAASNAQAKATLADSAAANANDKAGIAQTAATNADQKAAAAQTATTNANTATTNANTATNAANAAAATANAARGWQPLLVADTTTIAGKTLLKLQEWIGGTGTKPTTNVGQWQTAAGGYTATAASALDLNAVVTGNVVNRVSALEFKTKVVYNGNIEKAISSVDFDTDTIVSPAHGFSNGDKVTITKNLSLTEVVNPISLIPGGLKIQRYYVVNATTDTFQLSSYLGGPIVNITTNPTMDLSKIHIEKILNNYFQVTGLPPADAYRAIVRMSTTEYSAGLSIRANGFVHAPRWLTTGLSFYNYIDVLNSSNECYVDVILQNIGGRKIINCRGMCTTFLTPTTFSTRNEEKVLVDSVTTPNQPITEIVATCTAADFGILNGSTIEIYNL